MVASLRVGIIGAGWGALVQAPAFRLVDGYEVIALCGRTASRVEEAGQRLGLPDTSLDWKAFVERDDLDVISVATPSVNHSEMVTGALAAGKHVLCEKPLAINVAEADRLCALAENAGVATAICFELRWMPEREAIGRLVTADIVGRPYFVRMEETAPWGHPSHLAAAPWMYRLNQGGGYLNNMLSHDIDFICHLFGEPEAVCADVKVSVPTRDLLYGTIIEVDADDNSVLVIRIAGGATAVLSASVVSRRERRCHFEAFGASGSVAYERRGDHELSVISSGPNGVDRSELGLPREPRSGRAPPSRHSAPMVRAMALLLEDWLPAFNGLPADVPSFRDGLRVQRVIEAARSSSDGAGWVDPNA